ncbi:MAG: hypothetical protein HKN47_21605, partial [Pirellulaceae bacterium]|nr:hypothetical protein [Pirellulaceae bacterium]
MQSTRICHLMAPAAIVLLFGSTLLGLDRLGFRDVSHFYTPLYGYVAERTAQSWVPLWNPLDQTGIPLVGESTTAVFYPLRYFLFKLPIATEIAMAWYVVLHLGLASFAATWMARRVGVSAGIAPIAGIIYSLAGSVLFLYTNPPFLVGAAWLPFALGAMMATDSLSGRARVLIGSLSLAMMVLAGDPQSALHVVLLVVAIGSVRLLRNRDYVRDLRILVVLFASCLCAAALAAPQIAASISWSRQSARVVAVDDVAWHAPPKQGSVRSKSFQFSFPPWHVAEVLTPNAFGSLFPINRRISQVLPGDGRMWTPTIYLGMLAAVVLLGSIATYRRDQEKLWLSVACACLFLSMGHFGLVWWLQQIPGVLANRDSAMGGPYWFLYQFVPGYSAFRYPSKWLPLFSLAVSILVAQWVQRDSDERRPSITAAAWWLVGSLFVCLLGATWLFVAQPGWVERGPGLIDEYWGPLHISEGLAQVAWSLLHSLLVLLAILFVLRSSAFTRRSASLRVNVLMLLLVIDLGISAIPQIAKVPVATEEKVIRDSADWSTLSVGSRILRTQSAGGWPNQWKQSGHPQRLTSVAIAERASGFGRWHLEHRVNVLNNMTSIRSADSDRFWSSVAVISRGLDATERENLWSEIAKWLDLT